MGYSSNIGPVELKPAKTFHPQTGWSVVRRFRGAESPIYTLALQHKAAGARIEIRPDDQSRWWTLEATYGNDGETNEALADSWDLVGNDLEKSIWEHPSITAVTHIAVDPTSLAAVTKATNWRQFRAAVQAFVEGRLTIETDNGETVPLTMTRIMAAGGIVGLSDATTVKLVTSLLRGVESWSVSQWVLKHKVLVGRSPFIRPSLVNVGRIFTTSQLRAVEKIPQALRFDLPAGMWLKRTPTFEQAAADKWSMVQEWWHADSYDPFVYDAATIA